MTECKDLKGPLMISGPFSLTDCHFTSEPPFFSLYTSGHSVTHGKNPIEALIPTALHHVTAVCLKKIFSL